MTISTSVSVHHIISILFFSLIRNPRFSNTYFFVLRHPTNQTRELSLLFKVCNRIQQGGSYWEQTAEFISTSTSTHKKSCSLPETPQSLPCSTAFEYESDASKK